jgi:anaerobic magnesium-protoporphyrin IX monomethyl ester cyclase
MKICLINPLFVEPSSRGQERYFVRSGSRWPSSYLRRPGRRPRYVPFPFFMAYAAALLEKEGFAVSVLDAVGANLPVDALVERVVRERPDWIVYETTTPTLNWDLALATRLKERTGATIALSGTHVTTFPQETLEQAAAVDYVLLYEYEFTLLELLRTSSVGGELGSIAGVAYRKDGRVVLQRDYVPIDPLDRLPLPARHLFPLPDRPDMDAYWDGFCQHRPAVQMHASRGCPFRCDFCLWIQVMYRDGKYRTFSAERVADEMEDVVGRFKAREIYFDDDDFTVSKKHVLAICREIRRRGLRVPWSCMGDAVVPDAEMLDAMADAGCVGMKFGVESAAPEILARLGKPVDLQRVLEVARGCSRRGIKTHATITFGLWEETRETMERSLAFVQELDVDSVQFSITSPFPGTRYFEELRKSGRLTTLDWTRYDGSRSSVVVFPHLSVSEIESFCARAPSRWLWKKLRDPAWGLRQIRYLARLLKGQGMRGLGQRIRRALEILWSSS